MMETGSHSTASSSCLVGEENEAMCAHGLSVKQISDLLVEATVDTTNCILIHPTDDTVLSFDMVNGNKRFMFSDGQSYFADVVKSLSLNRVIESTIIRSFFDSYTARAALSDWNKMDRDTRSLFRKNGSSDNDGSHPTDLYRFFTSDIKRMLKRAVEQTMYSIDTTLNVAQRTLIRALQFHAVLNMVPCKPVAQQQGVKCKDHPHPDPTVSYTGYAYEHLIAQACMGTERDMHMTHCVPSQEDTVIVFNCATKRANAFSYEGGKLSPLGVMFFGGVSHETFTRRRDHPLVQTHSLCETVIHLEKYLHGMESAHMKVLKDLAFRSTVIIQNADDCEGGPVTKKSKTVKGGRDITQPTDPGIAQAMKEYKQEMGNCMAAVSKQLKQISNGSMSAAHTPLYGRNVTEAELDSCMNVNVFGKVITEGSIDVLGLVNDLQRQQAPLGGRDKDTTLAYIQSGTSKLQKEFVTQQHNNHSLRNALTASHKVQKTIVSRNEALMAEVIDSRQASAVQNRTLCVTQSNLDAANSKLQHMRRTMIMPDDGTKSTQDKANAGLCVNMVVDVQNQDDYNGDMSQLNDTRSVRYVNLSDSADNSLRYLNANFSVPPVDQSIREAARKAWESEVRSRFFLRDHVYSSTGNPVERQPSYDTTSIYIGGFCRQFMDFRILGRVVFDSSFISKTDTLEYLFACESEGSALDLTLSGLTTHGLQRK